MFTRILFCSALVAPLLMMHAAEQGTARRHQPVTPHLQAVPISQMDLAAIATWTAMITGLPKAEALPVLDFRTPQSLSILRYGSLAEPGGSEVLALYDAASEAILLPAGWTGQTPAESSMLVHEMVHHLQYRSGRRYACSQAKEDEAFTAQELWLTRHGTTLEREFGIDPFTRLVAGLCPY